MHPVSIPCDGTFLPEENWYVTGSGQVIRNVHGSDECYGRACVVHDPSEHSMRAFPTHWRIDRGIMERICEHGVGHPDPDDAAYHGDGIHGCDGCCAEIL